MRFNEKQREVLAEKLADLGNIAVGSLVFGYVVRSEVFNVLSLLLGLAIAAAAYIYAMALEK
jgi:hypothetical protein